MLLSWGTLWDLRHRDMEAANEATFHLKYDEIHLDNVISDQTCSQFSDSPSQVWLQLFVVILSGPNLSLNNMVSVVTGSIRVKLEPQIVDEVDHEGDGGAEAVDPDPALLLQQADAP